MVYIMLPQFIQNAIEFDFRHYTNAAYNIGTWILKSTETAIIGETRDFVRDPKAMIKKLTKEARESETGISSVSLGVLGGQYAVIKPTSQEQVAAILNAIDKDPKGRISHESFKFFSGTGFFILADTTPDAVFLRKSLAQFFVPKEYVTPVIDYLEEKLSTSEGPVHLRQTVCAMVRAVMVKKILDIDKLPLNTYEVMEDYRNDSKKWGAFPFPELMAYIPKLRAKRSNYQDFSHEIIKDELGKLVTLLQEKGTAAKRENLIASIVVGLIKKNNAKLTEEALSVKIKALSPEQIKAYFSHRIVQSLPMILKAADNLTDALCVCLSKIATGESGQQKDLEDELRGLVGEDDTISQQSIKKLPVLDAFYKESVRFDAPTVVPRYTSREIVQGDLTIPAKTMMIFDMGSLSKGEDLWTNPEDFDPSRFLEGGETSSRKPNEFPFLPFSTGSRMCPAFAITEVMFKTAVAKVVGQYDLKAMKGDGEELMVTITPKEKVQQCLDGCG